MPTFQQKLSWETSMKIWLHVIFIASESLEKNWSTTPAPTMVLWFHKIRAAPLQEKSENARYPISSSDTSWIFTCTMTQNQRKLLSFIYGVLQFENYSFSTFSPSPIKLFFIDEYLIRRFIFHNKILFWSLKYVRNPKS